MVNATLIYELGRIGASEEYLEAVTATTPSDVRNVARQYIESLYESTGVLAKPDQRATPALYALWLGNLKVAYRQADPNLAIVLEEAFDESELGLVEPTTDHLTERAI